MTDRAALPSDALSGFAPAAAPRSPAPPSRPFTGELTAWAEAALDKETAELAGWPKGSDGGRYRRVFKVAAQLGEIVAGGGLPADIVRSHVFDAAVACGAVEDYGEPKVREQIENGLRAGEANPRRAPEPKRKRVAKSEADVPEEPLYLSDEDDGAEARVEVVETADPEPPATTSTDPEDIAPVPELPAACWRPGFAEFRAAWSRTTEAPDGFLWGAYSIVAACVLGRQAQLDLGVEVCANRFIANVGDSGRARKSTGQAKAGRLLSRVDESVTVVHGIGSAEGLMDVLGVDSGLPMRSRRVLVNLAELSTLLRKATAEATRGLAPLLCTLYDCPPAVSLPTRKNPIEAENPYLCILGSTTPDWLRGDLSVDDLRGGLANRFEFILGKPKAPIPLPPPPVRAALDEAEHIAREARDRHSVETVYGFEPAARRRFEDWYVAERRRDYGSTVLEVLAQRLHVFAWKAALTFCALEGSPAISEPQMEAALAYADYQREAQAAVFSTYGTSILQQTIDRVLAALEKHGPLSTREVIQRVRHVETETVARALATVARIRLVEERQAGRKRVWALIGQRFGNALGNGSAKRKR